MSTFLPEIEFTEPERYELSEPPRYNFELNRREFVQTLGAGLLISVALPSALAQRAGGREASPAERLHIAEDGSITVFTSKVECGQGSRTQLTQAAAEELGVSIRQIKLVMADSAFGPNDGGTAGSRTTPSTVPAVRKGCAAARELLIETAAKRFGANIDALSVENGKVKGLSSGQQFGYADLAKDPSILQREPGSGATLREVSEWKVIGKSVPKVDGEDIVRGKHRYPSDIVRRGMLYGKVLRPPTYNAELVKVNLAAARTVEGAVPVRDGNFVGVAAGNSFLADRALQQLAAGAEWKQGPHPSSEELYEHLKSHPSGGRPRREVRGDPDGSLKGENVLRREFHIAYIQHAPMEPRAAVAEWEGEKLTVWTGTQQPQRVRDELARAFSTSADRVRVIVPDMGGGFGGKHSGETAVEAARLAKEAAKPVLLRWSREEEFTWAYFRPAGVITIASALADGSISAWDHVNYNSGASAIATPYEVPNVATEFRSCEAPLRAGSYRALASTANVFAREVMMDELAEAAGVNPLEFRLKHLRNERLRQVLIAAAENFQWNSRWRKNASEQSSGVGLACGIEKGSYAACCVQVNLDPSGVYRVAQVVEAYECGAIQNPRNLKAQVEGCIIQGLGGALYEEMRFRNGKIENARFSQYRVPRFKDVPPIETVLLDRKDLPSVGAGETPIIGIAPAIANAIANAVQVRIRSMPIRDASIRPA